MQPPSIESLRKEYTQATLDERTVAADPLDQFGRWLHEALEAQLPEPYAMTLATASASGGPTARIVLLRSFDAAGFVFYTNYESQKGMEIAAAGRAQLLFYWAELERQVRINGTLTRLDPAESERYFHSRPRESQIGAWASRQSVVIAGREQLERDYAEAEARFAGGEVPLPPFWGGYRLAPHAIEFWQGRPSRLHDRLRFRSGAGGWLLERLSP